MENTLATLKTQPQLEVATTASAAHAKALVEAKFTIAMHRPRNVLEARSRILDACRRPGFAQAARYAKPVGGTKIIGPSIRFAEEAIRAMTNIDTSTSLIYEDAEKLVMHVSVMDLEANTSYGEDIYIKKTVERSSLKGNRNVIGERTNTMGQKVYIVEATEDELNNKINAAKSKVIRNSGLRLVPQDIIDEAMQMIDKALAGSVKDPTVETRKLVDAFGQLRVSPADLEAYLGHPVDKSTPAEIVELREMWTTIKDGEAKFSDYVGASTKKAADTGSDLESLKTEEVQKPEPKKSASKTKESVEAGDVKSDSIECLTSRGVSFDDFREYLENQGIDKDATSYGSFEEVPSATYDKIQGKPLAKIVKLYATTDA